MTDVVRTEDEKLKDYVLDFEQRQRAHALEQAIIESPAKAAFELIYLRDLTKTLRTCKFGSALYGNCRLEEGHDGNHELVRGPRR